jgi:predicted glycosyltransferase
MLQAGLLKKNFLFCLDHPAKFNFFRGPINMLRGRGHQVDVVIITKDLLEDLVREEGWPYTNIYPEGRKIPGLHVLMAAPISLTKTIYRLLKYIGGRKYDLFIGDALVHVGRLKGVPSFYPTDDVIRQVPEQSVYLAFCNHILAPKITELGPFNRKAIRYDGYKAMAHLHPNWFKPDMGILDEGLRNGTPYFLIRCVRFSATHDLNHSGVNDEILERLVRRLEPRGKVLITSERDLPPDLEPYRIQIEKRNIAHYLYYAQLFIGDSTTMCSEAAVLGTPSVEFDDYFEEINQMLELDQIYGLTFGVKPTEPEALFKKVDELLSMGEGSKEIFHKRRDRMLSEKIDVSAFLIWLFENYPDSVSILKKDPDYQYRFK